VAAAVGTSLWLVPQQGESSRQLAARIDSLAQRLGTPRFEPHLTLLGGLEGGQADIVARSEVLARTLAPIELRIRDIEGSDEYFRCVFAAVERMPELVRAHEQAVEVFGWRPPQPFFPHVSLIYGALSSSARAGLLGELRERPAGTFSSGRLQVVSTEGPPERWRSLATFRLEHPSEGS
jgi:2'-5' RNA ligase